MLQRQTASSCSNTQYATATTEDAPYAQKQLQIAESDNLSPRAQKRKRVDEPDFRQIDLADHLELCDLLVTTNLPLDVVGRSAAARAILQKSGAKTSRDAPDEHTLMASVNDIYQLAHQKMLASVQPSQSATATADNSEYGPYHAQYWSMVSGSLDAGVPVPSNGGYQSPYGTAGPEAYFQAATANHNSHESFNNLSQANGYDHPDGSIYTLARNPQFATSMPQQQDLNTVYPSPVDNLSWNYFSPADADPQNLSTLDHLATQMLNMLLSRSMDDLMTMFTQSNSPNNQTFSNLQNAFEAAVRQLPRDTSNLFIAIDHLRLNGSSSATALLKANLAIFATSIFKCRDVPFLNLDAAFLDMFMPAGTRLLLNEGSLFLELKTQAFMALSMQGSDPRTLLEQLFPRDLQLTILRRRIDSHHLAATEQDFISRYNSRRQHLATCCDDLKALNQLSLRYSWHDLLTELRICVDRALEQLERSRNDAISPGSAASTEDPIARAALAAHAAISQQEPLALLAFTPPSEDAASNWSIHERNRSIGSGSSMSPESPYASMQLQYRNHIQAISVKPTSYPNTTTPPAKRHPNTHPNTRRPWTPDEEKALMDGLERVKGPHWSQILALYGAGGSISEILKERNQVQLKDKARNLKLFFLKSGMPVPSYLQKVTGELKTRAPAQAAKLEAREKLKKMEETKNQVDDN